MSLRNISFDQRHLTPKHPRGREQNVLQRGVKTWYGGVNGLVGKPPSRLALD